MGTHRRRSLRTAVIGHVEWARFARVPAVPKPGAIVHAEDVWDEVAGGGAVAAAQILKLAGRVVLFTAFGDDDAGRRSERALREMGIEVRAATRREPQRQAFVHLDANGERTITVLGDRMGPRRRDPLGWDELASFDAVYLTAGDQGALRAGRAARVLTATPRAMATLEGSGVGLDALVSSGRDAAERYREGDLVPPPRLVVATEGARGGRWREGRARGRFAAAPVPGPIVDAYGCGDSFAAGLTFGLAAGLGREAALQLAARCGAACLAGRGPYRGQLRLHRKRSRNVGRS